MSGWKKILASAGRWAVDLLFPPTCAVCGSDRREGEPVLCGHCRSAFPHWTGRACRICGTPLPDGGARCWACRHGRRAFGFCRSAGLYEGRLRQAILLLKYGGRDVLARPLGACLAETFRARPELKSVQLVVPVPLHFLKRHARGFNQAELLARFFAAESGLPLETRALARRRWTRAQAGLGREKRRANMENAFTVPRPDAVRGRRILLIDDVCTTGATLESCARALTQAGALRVHALTLARDAETHPDLRKKGGSP